MRDPIHDHVLDNTALTIRVRELEAAVAKLTEKLAQQPQVVTHNHYHYQAAPILQPPWQAV